MAGFGRGSRPGRRPSSSSSSSPFFSTVTMVVFVAFCLLAVWMLSSSSFVSTSSSRAAMDPAIRSRASLSSSRSKPSPSLFFKETDEGGDSDGEVAGVREVVEEVEAEVAEAGERAAEEKLAAPVVFERVDMGGEGDSGREGREEEANSESQSGGVAGVEENQPVEEEQQQQEEGPQQQEEGSQQQEEVTEEDSHREQLMEGGTEVNEQERPQGETGPEREELPSHATDRDNNGDRHEQQQQQEEEAVDHPIQKLEEEVPTETHELQSGGEGVDQQQHPEQQETVNAGDDTLDSQQLQQKQESEDGGTSGNEFHSGQELKDLEGDQNQMQQTVEGEAAVIEVQEQAQRQMEREEGEGGNEKYGGDPIQDIEERSKAPVEESQQQSADENLTDEPHVGDSLTYGAHPEVLPDAPDQKTPWSTQADQSQNAKEKLKESDSQSQMEGGSVGGNGDISGHQWKLCNATAGQDYIPCLDNEEALRHLHSTRHFEHRERHCPEEAPTCLVPLPKGYRRPIEWPKSRDRIRYNNVPYTKLAVVKGHQNWVKVTGEYLSFPGGGTQFIHGALHYVDFLQKSVRNIAWGKHTRVILDVGCGVASFGGYLFEKDVITMSFAPKDEHEAQVQLALERGIPAISAVMGSQRLPFPSKVFDLVHCARCRVPWHAEGGSLLLELNRVLRPGGYFVWSATPVYQKLKEDMEIWKEMTSLTKSLCWDLIAIRKDRLNGVGAAIYHKPISNECYDNRKQQMPPMCMDDDDPDTAWYVPLHSCMHRVPTDASERGSQWPLEWPRRLHVPPYWLNSSEVGVYGKSAPDDFTADYEHWKRVVSKSYLNGLGIDWSKVRNVMDMRAVYGGFAAALKDLKVWVMNVVNVDSPDTLPIIYERGLFGIYHDWCESFSTYPRTYDLLHADQLFSNVKKRCSILPVAVEVDRILRPGGKLLLRDEPKIVSEIESILRSLHWEVRLTFTKGREGILFAEKTDWRP